MFAVFNAAFIPTVYFFYPETKGLTLEEVAKVFDGDDAKVARINVSDVKKDLEVEKDSTVVAVKAL